ncbi:MAG: hypothetical protein ACLR7Z_01465 [Bilophila wadsworthia]
MRIILSFLFAAGLFLMPPAQAASLTVCNPAGQSEDGVYVDTILASSSGTAVDFPRADTETIEAAGDGLEAFNALFLARGWGDGLPLVPPTPERVKAMLAGYDLPDDFPIATLPPLDGVATVGKIAVNAVMAGCEPRHMPLLVAAVEAVSQPEFDLRGVATTTNPDSVLVIVSGPIVKRLGINAGTNTFGRGNRANACIGRALHLIISNVGGSRPGITDMSTSVSRAISPCSGRNAGQPWPSFHEYGFLPERNVVTVAAVESTPASWASTAALNIWISSRHGAGTTGPPPGITCSSRRTPRRCSQGRLDAEAMRQYIREQARIPFGEWNRQYHGAKEARKGVPEEVFAIADPNELVDKPFFDSMPIIVAGGTGEKSMLLPCWASGKMVSQEIRLPASWGEGVR